MSELERMASDGLAVVAAPAAGAPQQWTEDPRRQTYWAVVGRAYWRSTLSRIATAWTVMVIVLSALVPFVSNQAPITAVIDGKREWPMLRDLSRVDWIWLMWVGAGIIFLWACRRTGKRIVEVEVLRAARNWWFVGLMAAAIVGTIAVSACKTDYLDARDYHQMARDGGLKGAIFAPWHWGFTDQEPLVPDRTFEFPTKDHWLGTDGNGRDAMARLLWGARVVLEIGLVSEVISLVIGVIYGALMGYFVGTVDLLGMRFVEVVEAVPTLFLLITFVALFGRSLLMIMVILGLVGWTGIARFVRAEFLRMRQLDYVSAARALGLPLRNILFKHMLPNGLTPVIVTFTFGVAGNVVSESILSFLGIGVEPPTPSWGSMLNEAGNPAETFRWWLAIAPGLMIFLTVFAYNIIGEGLRDAIDPRLNKME
jgi:peptide/nickel transport system permease protein